MIRRHDGFTLIELMIVIAVMGVIMAIALPNYLSMVDRSREASVQAIAHTLELGVVEWSVIHDGVYPQLGDIDAAMFQRFEYPPNPFTGADVQVNGPGFSQGNIGYAVALGVYVIEGYGKDITSGPAGDGVVSSLTND